MSFIHGVTSTLSSFRAKQRNDFVFFRLDPTENNHEATELQEVMPDEAKEAGAEDEAGGFKVKERSILQAKLTKLAIQIGYAGNGLINSSRDSHCVSGESIGNFL